MIERLRALEKDIRDEADADIAESCNPEKAEWVRDKALARGSAKRGCANRIAAILTDLGQEVVAVADGEAVEVVVCELGDYGPVDREMVTVLFDDMKIAECYRAEDAEYVAAALREYSSPAHTSEARDGAAILAWRLSAGMRKSHSARL